MPAITATSLRSAGATAVTEVTLDGSDSFTYTAANNPVLVLRNPTASPITATIDGDGSTTVDVSGVPTPLDVSGGYSTGAIAANTGIVYIRLASIAAYLDGTLAINNGTGLVASLLER